MSPRTALCLLAVLCCAGCLSAGPTGVDSREATVERVVDGDTLEVRFADGSRETVRLLGVDSPETRAESAPGEFEGVPDTAAGRDCLRRAGEGASAFARERLAGARVRVHTDPLADRRGGYGRLLAYVTRPGANVSFNRALLTAGHARLFDGEFERLAQFRTAERRAREAGRGLWRCAS